MVTLTGVLFLLLLILPILFLFKLRQERKRFTTLIDRIPGPAKYPLIGTSLELVFTDRLEIFKVIQKRTRQYYPIFRTWHGSEPSVHLLKPEHIEKVVNNSVHLDKSFFYRFAVPWLGEGLLTATGSRWHKNRKLITPTFHFQILDTFIDVFDEKSRILLQQLDSRANGKEFNIYPYITHCALDIICETAMGVQVDAMANGKSDYVEAIYGMSEIISKRNITPWMHPDLLFYMSSHGKRFKKYLSILHGFTHKVIAERKVAIDKTRNEETFTQENEMLLGKKKRKAFLDLLLATSQNGKLLTDTEIREEVDTFMFEGHDTTTAGICWTLFMLGNHPDVQDKVYEELESIFHGEDRPVTMLDLSEMKCLERVIKEALRLYPSVPFLSRSLSEDVHLDNYILPAGCPVVIHIYDVHRVAEHFPDPGKFDPDRFLPENSRSRHPYAYIPFSAGPRNCIGQKFAMLEEKTVISGIIRKYKVCATETPENMKILGELILRPQDGLNIHLERRT